MPTFPTTESAILMLAQQLNSGLWANTGLYPAPPVPPNNIGWYAVMFILAGEQANMRMGEAQMAFLLFFRPSHFALRTSSRNGSTESS